MTAWKHPKIDYIRSCHLYSDSVGDAGSTRGFPRQVQKTRPTGCTLLKSKVELPWTARGELGEKRRNFDSIDCSHILGEDYKQSTKREIELL